MAWWAKVEGGLLLVVGGLLEGVGVDIVEGF